MTLIEIIILSIALAMDASAVGMTNGMVYKNVSRKHLIAMPILFGFFQGFMPLIGFFAGGFFANILEQYSGIVILVILCIIGGKMVYEGLRGESAEKADKSSLTATVLIMQAIATSIDAFAVGVAFAAMTVKIMPIVSIIALITAIVVAISLWIGKYVGDFLGSKAEIIGGIVLIIIGIKAIL